MQEVQLTAPATGPVATDEGGYGYNACDTRRGGVRLGICSGVRSGGATDSTADVAGVSSAETHTTTRTWKPRIAATRNTYLQMADCGVAVCRRHARCRGTAARASALERPYLFGIRFATADRRREQENRNTALTHYHLTW